MKRSRLGFTVHLSLVLSENTSCADVQSPSFITNYWSTRKKIKTRSKNMKEKPKDFFFNQIVKQRNNRKTELDSTSESITFLHLLEKKNKKQKTSSFLFIVTQKIKSWFHWKKFYLKAAAHVWFRTSPTSASFPPGWAAQNEPPTWRNNSLLQDYKTFWKVFIPRSHRVIWGGGGSFLIPAYISSSAEVK